MNIYLACPYSHEDEQIKQVRFFKCLEQARYLTSIGHGVFAPIVSGHMLVSGMPEHLGVWKHWAWLDEAALAACELLEVMCMDGWTESVGIGHEVRRAKWLFKNIEYLRFDVRSEKEKRAFVRQVEEYHGDRGTGELWITKGGERDVSEESQEVRVGWQHRPGIKKEASE